MYLPIQATSVVLLANAAPLLFIQSVQTTHPKEGTMPKGTRKPLRAADVTLRGKAAKEAKQHEATMAAHRAGYDAYVAARTEGRKADQEQHRPDYTAYKRAYAALLRLRHAEAAKQQAKGDGERG
jgi:hypothetical protein